MSRANSLLWNGPGVSYNAQKGVKCVLLREMSTPWVLQGMVGHSTSAGDTHKGVLRT